MAFAQSIGNYSEISGGVLLGNETSDDQRFVDPAVPLGGTVVTGVGFDLGFDLTVNGNTFNRVAINNNGWISLGNSGNTPAVDNGSTSAYTPLSSTTANVPAHFRTRIAGMGADLQGQVGSTLRIETIGSAPNRVCVVQWKNFRRYLQTGMILNFQIRMNETTNVIELAYGSQTFNATSNTINVGIGGSVATDFTNRLTAAPHNWNQTTAGFINTSSCTAISSGTPPVSGLTFTFTPPVACSGPASPSGVVTSSTGATSTILCTSGAVGTLYLSGYQSGVSGFTFQWQNSADNVNYADIAGQTGTTYAAPVATGSLTYYRVKISCSGNDAFSAPYTVNPPQSPITQASNVNMFMNGTYAGATITWTNGSGSNRMVVINTSNSFVDPVNGTTAPVANTVYSGSGQQTVYASTGATVTITGLNCSTAYFVKVYEYNVCTTPAPASYYFNVGQGPNNPLTTGNASVSSPYSQDFNASTVLNNSGFAAVTSSYAIAALHANGTGNGLYKTSTTVTGEIRLPKMVVAANQRLKYDTRVVNSSLYPATAPAAGWGNGEVLISTDCGATFVSLGTYTDVAGLPWVTKYFNLSSYSGMTVVIKLKATWLAGAWFADYDNVAVEEIPPGCNGTPNPGTAAGPAAVCTGVAFSVTLTGQTNTPGITLQWQKSPASANTWTDIAGATSSSLSASQTAATDYRAVVTCTNAPPATANSNVVAVGMNSFMTCYCSSIAATTFDEDLTDVTVNGVSNTTTCASLGGAGSILNRYNNYTGVTPTDITVGSTVPISMTSFSCGGAFTNKLALYIDFNHNGLYTDAGEEVFESAAVSGNHIATGSFIVPGGALTGLTGMRAMNVETSGDVTPCMTYSYGETEDYLINILPPPPCTGTPAAGTISGTAATCPGGTVTLTLAGYDPLATITLQWQSSSDGISYSNVAGATSASYTSGALTADIWYQVVVTCGNSGLSSTSPALAVNVEAPSGGTVSGPTTVTVGVPYTWTAAGMVGNIIWQFSSDNITYTDIAGATLPSQSLTVNAAGTFYLRIKASLAGCTDAFSAPIIVNATVAEYNNVCNAVSLPVDGLDHGPYTYTLCTTQTGEPFPPAAGCSVQHGWCIATISNTAWFSFVAPASGRVKVDATPVTGTTDNQLAMYSADDCDDLLSSSAKLIAANDDAIGLVAQLTAVSCLTPGVTYYIQLDPYSANAAGSYNLKVTDLGGTNPDATFSGLTSPACSNGAAQTMTAVTTPGLFSGDGVTGSAFNPVTAGVGLHTVTYRVYGTACESTQNIAVDQATAWAADSDGDGYGDANATATMACTNPGGMVNNAGDCDDSDPDIHPGAAEACGNSIDEDCDGVADDLADFNPDIIPDCKTTLKNKVLIGGVAGGAAPFLYSKDGLPPTTNPSFTNITSPSTHTFSTTSADGCTLTKTVTFEIPMVLSSVVTNVTCNGFNNGAIDLSVAEGYGNYSFEWFKGTAMVGTTEDIEDLFDGTYKVEVTDAEGCVGKGTAAVTEPAKIVIKLTASPVLCNGESTGSVINVSSGGTGLTFSWTSDLGYVSTTQDAINVPSATYTVVATDLNDNACTATKTKFVSEPTLLTASATSKAAKCFNQASGSAKTIGAGGKAPRTYKWNGPGTVNETTQEILNKVQGTYTCLVTDANLCTATVTIVIGGPTAALAITGIASEDNDADGDYNVSLTVAGGTPSYKYAYQLLPGGTITTFKPLATILNMAAGNYKFYIKDKNLCETNATSAIPVPPLKPAAKPRDENGDKAIISNNATDFRLVPNPTSGAVSLVFAGETPTQGTIEVHTASGQLIQTLEVAAIGQTDGTLRLNNLPTGVLFVSFNANENRITKRLVVLHK